MMDKSMNKRKDGQLNRWNS